MNRSLFQRVKNASVLLARSGEEERNRALEAIADAISANRGRIRESNDRDVEEALRKGEKEALVSRLKYTDSKMDQSVKGLEEVKSLPDPVFRIREEREIDASFILKKVTVPLGVIGMIFEARPDALVQIASLALKSGNGLILKGGSEAAATNRVLVDIIKGATKGFSFTSDWIDALETREDVKELLLADEWVDLIIPRGSNSFVRYVMDNTHIPVLGHSDGLCITYVENTADVGKAVKILVDAKTQYPAACNSTETILVESGIAPSLLPRLSEAFREIGVTVHADERALKYFPDGIPAVSSDWDTEYLSLECAVKVVDSTEEAVGHIAEHSSKHTDAIITEDAKEADWFTRNVDSADVFVNCSTRFADGYRFGLGSEVGISTSRLHARGPVGLDGLMTTKWILTGRGETVGEYSGKNPEKTFHFRDIKL